jgi:tripartite-type tricarboxylate transporter receptor subunit TctC
MFNRRCFTRLLAALVAMGAFTASAQDTSPDRPIRMVAPLGPGSAVDRLARVTAEACTPESKGTLVVENKAGAGVVIVADSVAKAKPHGYTLRVFHSSVLTASAAVNPKLP